MIHLEVAAVTHRGIVRADNEDTVAVAGFLSSARGGAPVILRIASEEPVTCLVADGLGGHAAGRRASRVAAAAFLDENPVDPESAAAAVRAANHAVHAEMLLHDTWRGMGTTLAAAVFAGDHATCVNVGDSRCYRSRSGILVPLSQDDSPLPPPGGGSTSVVTQTLGGTAAERSLDSHLLHVPTTAGDRFLLCSDGLSDHVPESDLEKALADFTDNRSAAAHMLHAALAAGAPDNVSIVLAQVLA